MPSADRWAVFVVEFFDVKPKDDLVRCWFQLLLLGGGSQGIIQLATETSNPCEALR